MSDKFTLPIDALDLTIEVNAAGYPRENKVVEINLGMNVSNAQSRYIQVSELLDGSEERIIQHQLNLLDGLANLSLLMAGVTEANQTRRFRVCSQPHTQVVQSEPLVSVIDGVHHEEQDSIRIQTSTATYLYHKYGAGFASIIDRDGADWISYHPWGGSDGKYRGIPNLVYPESYFHPGSKGLSTRIEYNGSLHARLVSETDDGLWCCQWDIFPNYARLTVVRAAGKYWFLYEGTPGGSFDPENDYCVRSTGERAPLSASWQGTIPAPRWLYFGSSRIARVLYLVHHEADETITSYWPMEGNMTVFGFGRLNTNKYLTAVPAQFTIGFSDTSDTANTIQIINSAFQPLMVSVGSKNN